MGEASYLLVLPAEPDENQDGFSNPLDIFNYISPSAWLNDLLSKTVGWDIFGYVSEAFTGEWEALYKFGDVMNNLAQAMQQIGVEIQAGADELDGRWDGNAGDAAYIYFTQLATATSGQQTGLYAAGNGYHDAARGAWLLAGQVGNILQAIIDEGILMGIAVGAGTATLETGIGPVIGYSMAAYQAVQIINLANKASKIINTAGIALATAFGGGLEVAGQGGDLSAVPLPSAGYTPPGA